MGIILIRILALQGFEYIHIYIYYYIYHQQKWGVSLAEMGKVFAIRRGNITDGQMAFALTKIAAWSFIQVPSHALMISPWKFRSQALGQCFRTVAVNHTKLKDGHGSNPYPKNGIYHRMLPWICLVPIYKHYRMTKYHIDQNLVALLYRLSYDYHISVAIYGLSYWSKFSQKTLPTLVVNKSLTHGWLLLPDIKDVMGKVRHAWPPATRKRDAIYGGRFMLCMYVYIYILYHIYILYIIYIYYIIYISHIYIYIIIIYYTYFKNLSNPTYVWIGAAIFTLRQSKIGNIGGNGKSPN